MTDEPKKQPAPAAYKELRADARGRVILGDWTQPDTRYIAQLHPGGDVTLTVAKLVPARLVAEFHEADGTATPAGIE